MPGKIELERDEIPREPVVQESPSNSQEVIVPLTISDRIRDLAVHLTIVLVVIGLGVLAWKTNFLSPLIDEIVISFRRHNVISAIGRSTTYVFILFILAMLSLCAVVVAFGSLFSIFAAMCGNPPRISKSASQQPEADRLDRSDLSAPNSITT